MRSSLVDSGPRPQANTPVFPAHADSHIQYRRGAASPLPAQTPAQARHIPLAPVEGWSPLLLLAIAMWSIVFSVTRAQWMQPSLREHTIILFLSVPVGLLLGLLVAKSRRLPQAILHLGACLVGHWFSVWLTCVVAYDISWMLLLGYLRSAITGNLSSLTPAANDMVFLFYLSFLCFFLSYFGTWLVYRARLPWMVALVYCSILLVNLNFSGDNLLGAMMVAVGALLLLIARVQLANQLIQWKREGLHTDQTWLRGVIRRCMQVACLLSVVTLLLSWTLPALAQPSQGVSFWNQLDNAWTNVLNGHVSWQNPGSIVQPYQSPANFFGNQLAITGSVNLPAGEVLSYTSSAGAQYLEGFTFDSFDGHTWTMTNTISQHYNADMTLPIDTSNNVTSVKTTVTLVQPPIDAENYIFGPAEPVKFDIDTVVYGNAMPVAWAQQSPLTKGESYQVTSIASSASSNDLSAIPLPLENLNFWQQDTNYATLNTYYLQVPKGLSPNVWRTAQQWTRGATNTYQALRMLEAHLSDQNQFVYSVTNTPVPSNVDAVDWLLQTRHGYCTYYATAMTVMARQLGIPARVVSGFSHGTYDAQHKDWVVNGQDAHSWVQAYFPGYGWINFDPTPGFSNSTITNPLPTATPAPTKPPTHATPSPVPSKKGSQPPQLNGSQNGSAGKTTGQVLDASFLAWFSLASVIFSLLVLCAALVNYWWRNLYAGSPLAAGVFWRVCRLASLIGFSPRQSQTPYEYSALLSRQFPREAAPLRRLTDLFVRERWAPHHLPYSTGEDEVNRLWPALRRLLFHLAFNRRKTSSS